MSNPSDYSLDSLARSLADGTLSRRQVVVRTSAGLLAALLARSPLAWADKDQCPPGHAGCDGKCCPRGAHCRRGKCHCPKGERACGPKCVDPETDPKHCGGCHHTCASGQECKDGTCAASATCSDGIKNGTETDVDCGGAGCPGCVNGKACVAATDCQSGVCTDNVCADPAPTCSDGVKNGSETDVDCGGGTCPPCEFGRTCGTNSDCQSNICHGGSCVNCVPNAPISCAGGVQTTCNATGSGTVQTPCSTANGTAVCSGGTCHFNCDAGFVPCDGACRPPCGPTTFCCPPGTTCVSPNCI